MCSALHYLDKPFLRSFRHVDRVALKCCEVEVRCAIDTQKKNRSQKTHLRLRSFTFFNVFQKMPLRFVQD